MTTIAAAVSANPSRKPVSVPHPKPSETQERPVASQIAITIPNNVQWLIRVDLYIWVGPTTCPAAILRSSRLKLI
jgi:hypothetical protein